MTVHHVVPNAYPASGPIPAHQVDELSLLTGGGAANLKDMSWRWLHHNATLVDPNLTTAVDAFGTRFNPIAWNLTLGGGDGPLDPYIGFESAGSADQIVDVNNTPVWSLLIAWRSLGAIDNHGDPPTLHSSSVGRPGLPSIPSQPIIGSSYTNGPWMLYLAFNAAWVGSAGSWDLVISPILKLSYGGSGGTTVTISAADVTGGTTMLEFDNTADTISMYHGQPGAWTLLGTIAGTTAQSFGHILGGGTIGPYYWTWFLHLYGYIESLAIIGDSAAYTTELINAYAIEPGGGPPVTVAEWRASAAPDPPTSARLGLYSHYWPLDDASPGPMIDIVAGSRLSVVAPSVAEFEVDGEPGTVGHTQGIRLGPPTTTATMTYLKSTVTGTPATIGPGGVGHDFTVTMRAKWEGPRRNGETNRALFRSSTIRFGSADEVAVGGYIGIMYAEPFGVRFLTWDGTHHVFEDLRTADFDWPAEFELVDGVPTKIPTWAHVAFVYRTVAGAVQKEIWIDGVLLATGAADAGGFGGSVTLADVGLTLGGTLQDVALWPFALTADEISIVHG